MRQRAASRRPPVFGPDWCYLVAALDHDGDLWGLEAALVAGLRDPFWGRQAIAEATATTRTT